MLSRTRFFSEAGTFVQFHSGCSLANRLASSLAKAYINPGFLSVWSWQRTTGTEPVAGEGCSARGVGCGVGQSYVEFGPLLPVKAALCTGFFGRRRGQEPRALGHGARRKGCSVSSLGAGISAPKVEC